MKRMMKKPQALHPDAPLLNLGHGKPISRRDMLGRGLVSGAAFGSVGLFGLFSNPREAMAALQGDLETIKTDCGILGAGAGKIPFICFDLAGGANIAGSNVLGLGLWLELRLGQELGLATAWARAKTRARARARSRARAGLGIELELELGLGLARARARARARASEG